MRSSRARSGNVRLEWASVRKRGAVDGAGAPWRTRLRPVAAVDPGAKDQGIACRAQRVIRPSG